MITTDRTIAKYRQMDRIINYQPKKFFAHKETHYNIIMKKKYADTDMKVNV